MEHETLQRRRQRKWVAGPSPLARALQQMGTADEGPPHPHDRWANVDIDVVRRVICAESDAALLLYRETFAPRGGGSKL